MHARWQAGAVAAMFMGLTIANVVGVPLATWTGAHLGWRASFWGIAGLGVATMIALRLTLPRLPAPEVPLASWPLKGLRLAIPTTIVLEDLDPEVSSAFETCLMALTDAGALLTRTDVPEFADIVAMNSKGGFAAAESYAWHAKLLATSGDGYDPRVAMRIRRGSEQSAADYLALLSERKRIIAAAETRFRTFDAMLMPTVACIPPTLASMDDDATFTRENLRALRNCTMINVINGCAVSIPIAPERSAPVGLMIAGLANADHRVLGIAAAIEAHLNPLKSSKLDRT